MKYKNILILFISCLSLFSCDEFLEEDPIKHSNRTIETVEDLDLILSSPLRHHNWTDHHIFCSDNFSIDTALYNERPEGFPLNQLQSYLWDTKINASSDLKWSKIYQTIWDANMIIDAVDDNVVSGDQNQKNIVKAEAHLLRAYCFFELAIAYSLHPTVANNDKPGISLRLHTDFEENISRASIKETYAQIESDLAEALEITVTERKSWRASKSAAAAFAARYYLYVGDYAKAKEHADAALSSYSTMLNFENDIQLLEEDSNGLVYPSTSILSFATPGEFFDFWVEQYQLKYISVPGVNVVPSQDLLNLYDVNDLRFEYFIVEDYSKFYNHFNVIRPGYIASHAGTIISGPSVPEMYYIRAECNAREGNIAGAMTDVENVRINRFAAANYSVLDLPATPKDAVELIIDERRREFPFSIRWYDLRRLNADDLLDNITITRSFFPMENGEITSTTTVKEYVLEPDSKRYARPIGTDVITSGNGATKQNEY